MNSRVRADLALAGVTLIWGATFVVVQNALREISTLLFLALRFSLATAVLLLVYRRRLYGARKGGWLTAALAGLFLFAGYLLQTFGLRYTAASKSAFLTGLAVVMAPFLNSLVYRIWPQFLEGLGVLIALAGMALLTLTPGRLTIGLGDLLTVGCALAFAFHIVAVGHFSRTVSMEVLSLGQIGAAAAMAMAIVPWAEPLYVSWSAPVIFAILLTGTGATALAFTVQTWAQQHTTATRTALVFALEPVFAAVTSFLVNGEILNRRQFGGAVLILGGVILTEVKPPGTREHLSS